MLERVLSLKLIQKMPNPHGRTPDTKNRKGHSAGGVRKGVGQKKQLTDQEKKDKGFLDVPRKQ